MRLTAELTPGNCSLFPEDLSQQRPLLEWELGSIGPCETKNEVVANAWSPDVLPLLQAMIPMHNPSSVLLRDHKVRRAQRIGVSHNT